MSVIYIHYLSVICNNILFVSHNISFVNHVYFGFYYFNCYRVCEIINTPKHFTSMLYRKCETIKPFSAIKLTVCHSLYMCLIVRFLLFIKVYCLGKCSIYSFNLLKSLSNILNGQCCQSRVHLHSSYKRSKRVFDQSLHPLYIPSQAWFYYHDFTLII